MQTCIIRKFSRTVTRPRTRTHHAPSPPARKKSKTAGFFHTAHRHTSTQETVHSCTTVSCSSNLKCLRTVCVRTGPLRRGTLRHREDGSLRHEHQVDHRDGSGASENDKAVAGLCLLSLQFRLHYAYCWHQCRHHAAESPQFEDVCRHLASRAAASIKTSRRSTGQRNKCCGNDDCFSSPPYPTCRISTCRR